MSALVGELREWGHPLAMQAADEIDRLTSCISDVTKERDELRRTNAELGVATVEAMGERDEWKRHFEVANAKDHEAIEADRVVSRALGREEMRAYAELATEALTELLRQVEAFVAENGEADFYTGQAKEVLAKNPFDPLRHETCTKSIERAAAEFCNAYHAEFFSAQAVTEKWPGWVDGYDPGETIDAAFLALRSALNDSRHQSGKKPQAANIMALVRKLPNLHGEDFFATRDAIQAALEQLDEECVHQVGRDEADLIRRASDLFERWNSTDIDPDDEEYEPWIADFTASVASWLDDADCLVAGKKSPARVNCGKCDHPMGCETECRIKAASDSQSAIGRES